MRRHPRPLTTCVDEKRKRQVVNAKLRFDDVNHVFRVSHVNGEHAMRFAILRTLSEVASLVALVACQKANFLVS